jgi:hypothetical protein
MVGGDTLEPADRDRAFLDTAAAACGFARAVTDPAENAGKNIGLAVLDVGVAEPALGDKADVLGNIRMCRTGPLAVDDLVEVLRVGGVSRFHSCMAPGSSHQPAAHPVP